MITLRSSFADRACPVNRARITLRLGACAGRPLTLIHDISSRKNSLSACRKGMFADMKNFRTWSSTSDFEIDWRCWLDWLPMKYWATEDDWVPLRWNCLYGRQALTWSFNRVVGLLFDLQGWGIDSRQYMQMTWGSPVVRWTHSMKLSQLSAFCREIRPWNLKTKSCQGCCQLIININIKKIP